MMIIAAHNAAQSDASNGQRPGNAADPYSLSGLPQGDAGDLLAVARKSGSVRRTDGSAVKI